MAELNYMKRIAAVYSFLLNICALPTAINCSPFVVIPLLPNRPKAALHSFRGFCRTCRDNGAPILTTLLRHYWYKRLNVSILAPNNVRIEGIQNIATPNGTLNLLLSCGAIDGHEPTVLDVMGRLLLHGDAAIAQGCRVDIGPRATVEIGHQTYINPRTQLIIKHGLRIGHQCAISWECQFLDEDFHVLVYEGQRKLKNPEIVLGDHVWIGSRVSIYKGTVIPSGCVVASNSVVKGVFTEENALLAGNPARIVHRNVQW